MTKPESQLTITPIGAFYVTDMGWPISFNSYKDRYGRTSQKGRIWRDTVVDTIWAGMGAGPADWIRPEPCIGKVAVNWEIWMPDDKRKRDIDNFTGKHCLDALAKAGLMLDDCQVWEEHKYQRGKWAKGHVIVTVHEL